MPFIFEQDGKRILNDGSLYVEPGSPIPDLNETGHLASWNEMLDQLDAGEADLICITVTDEASARELEAYLRSESNPAFSRFQQAISTSKLKIEGMPPRRQRNWSVD